MKLSKTSSHTTAEVIGSVSTYLSLILDADTTYRKESTTCGSSKMTTPTTTTAPETIAFPLSELALYRFPTTHEKFAEKLFLTDFCNMAEVPKARPQDIPDQEKPFYVTCVTALLMRNCLNIERLDRRVCLKLRIWR